MSVGGTGSGSRGRGCVVRAVLGVVLSVSPAAGAETRLRGMVVMTGRLGAGGSSGSWWVPSGTADLPPPAEGLGAELASPLTLRAYQRPSAHAPIETESLCSRGCQRQSPGAQPAAAIPAGSTRSSGWSSPAGTRRNWRAAVPDARPGGADGRAQPAAAQAEFADLRVRLERAADRSARN